MKYILFHFILLTTVVAQYPVATTVYDAHVVSIKDGDTIVVDINLGFGIYKRGEVIRFLGVYAPETFRPKTEKERVDGLIVKQYLTNRLTIGESIVVVTNKDRRDGFGRILGNVWDVDGCVNDGVLEYMKDRNIPPNKK